MNPLKLKLHWQILIALGLAVITIGASAVALRRRLRVAA